MSIRDIMPLLHNILLLINLIINISVVMVLIKLEMILYNLLSYSEVWLRKFL